MLRRGMRFKHARILDPMYMPNHVPQIFQVTSISRGMVYYAPVIDYGTREEIGKSRDCSLKDEFWNYVLEVV